MCDFLVRVRSFVISSNFHATAAPDAQAPKVRAVSPQ